METRQGRAGRTRQAEVRTDDRTNLGRELIAELVVFAAITVAQNKNISFKSATEAASYYRDRHSALGID